MGHRASNPPFLLDLLTSCHKPDVTSPARGPAGVPAVGPAEAVQRSVAPALAPSGGSVWRIPADRLLPPPPSDHAAPHQRQPAAHAGAHGRQQDVVALPRRAAGRRAAAAPRLGLGRGSAHREAVHGGPGGLGARVPGAVPTPPPLPPSSPPPTSCHLPLGLGAGPCPRVQQHLQRPQEHLARRGSR